MFVDIYNTDKKYNIIYADPPWQYKAWSGDKGKRTAESFYRTMKKEDIQSLPVEEIADKNAVLFLWVTAPCLEEGIELLKKWGFTYKTIAFTWIKKNKKQDTLFWGMGHYTRANAEFCLLGTRGKALKRQSHSVHSVVMSKIREHSRKPEEVRGGG